VDMEDNANGDNSDILSDSPPKPDSLAAAAKSSSSSDMQQLASIRHMADTFARSMMSADFAGEARPEMCPLLQSPQWSNELAVATLAGMWVVAELIDDEDTEANANARIRCRLQHILALPDQQ